MKKFTQEAPRITRNIRKHAGSRSDSPRQGKRQPAEVLGILRSLSEFGAGHLRRPGQAF